MKKLIALAALGLTPGLAWAHHPTVSVTTTTIERVAATFESRAGCITTVVTVDGTDQVTRNSGAAPERDRLATLTVKQLYEEANATPGHPCPPIADPTIQDSSVTIEDPKLVIAGNVRKAELKGSSSQFFDVHAGVFRTMSFDLKWKASGKLIGSTACDPPTTSGGTTTFTCSSSVKFPATASGSVREGQVNHTPVPTTNANPADPDTSISRVITSTFKVKRK
jgi:hypothetical protein